MHRSALEINEIRRKLIALPMQDAQNNLLDYMNQYNSCLQKWSVNHEEIDFFKYKYKHKWEFGDIADLTEKELPDRKFQEMYDISTGAVVLVTLIGAGVIAFVGYILWDSISYDAEAEVNPTAASEIAVDASSAAVDAAAAATAAAEDAAAAASFARKHGSQNK